jgi:enolase
MSSLEIERIKAREILDSRGRPTIEAACRLASGARGRASVPSGASTGEAEAHELRDGDPQRFAGLGCCRAVAHVNRDIHDALAGQRFAGQAEFDETLCRLDGSANKSRLGANAILAVSLAFARAAARQKRMPLYRYFESLGGMARRRGTLPRPTINLFSGGKHAGQQSPLQDVLLVPVAARSIQESLATAYAVYEAASHLIRTRYGMRPLKADEGGLAPQFGSAESMLADAVDAIIAADFRPGSEVALAVDVASSHFFVDGKYRLGDEQLDSPQMIQRIDSWVSQYPIVSIEDGLSQGDWESWPKLRAALSGRALTVGDDLLCTNAERIQRAIDSAAADTLLLKVNQIGTITEALEALRLARLAGWQVTISARSGETEDHWLADLAAGWRGEQIKVGSIMQSDRLAKYNRLLAIEAATGWPLVTWPAGTN